MKCPFCSSDLGRDAIDCEKCGATRVIRRTAVGVFAAWLGMVIGFIWLMMWIPLLFLPFVGYDMSAYPWTVLITGTIVAVALLWYSKSTRHPEWIRQKD